MASWFNVCKISSSSRSSSYSYFCCISSSNTLSNSSSSNTTTDYFEYKKMIHLKLRLINMSILTLATKDEKRVTVIFISWFFIRPVFTMTDIAKRELLRDMPTIEGLKIYPYGAHGRMTIMSRIMHASGWRVEPWSKYARTSEDRMPVEY